LKPGVASSLGSIDHSISLKLHQNFRDDHFTRHQAQCRPNIAKHFCVCLGDHFPVLESCQIDARPNHISNLSTCGLKGPFDVLKGKDGLPVRIISSNNLPGVINSRGLGYGNEWPNSYGSGVAEFVRPLRASRDISSMLHLVDRSVDYNGLANYYRAVGVDKNESAG
jgi:hypothetical protein